MMYPISALWRKDETGWASSITRDVCWELYHEAAGDQTTVEDSTISEVLANLVNSDTLLLEGRRKIETLQATVSWWTRRAAIEHFRLTGPQQEVFTSLADDANATTFEELLPHAQAAKELA